MSNPSLNIARLGAIAKRTTSRCGLTALRCSAAADVKPAMGGWSGASGGAGSTSIVRAAYGRRVR
jgi:hypothetical protein